VGRVASSGGKASAKESCVKLPSVTEAVVTAAAPHRVAPSGSGQVQHVHFNELAIGRECAASGGSALGFGALKREGGHVGGW